MHLHVSGGTLGFYCRHEYNHTNVNGIVRLRSALKGVDAMFYSVFDHLGLVLHDRGLVGLNIAYRLELLKDRWPLQGRRVIWEQHK